MGSKLPAIVKACIKPVDLVCKVFPIQKDKIVVDSYFTSKPEGNLKCIVDGLKEEKKWKIVLLFTQYANGMRGKLAYILHIFREVYHFNTARLIILEGNSLTLSCIKKKKGVRALQVWHASGAFKKFGADTKRLYDIKNLDAALVSSREFAEIYAQAFSLPVDKVYEVGVPRLDLLASGAYVEQLRRKMEQKYPVLQHKKLALWAPTFRGQGVDDVSLPPMDFKRMEQALPGKWVLGVRLHPNITSYDKPETLLDLTREDLIEVLSATDLLITDYSSIIYEFSMFGKPMVFYVPDLEHYKGDRGFYMEYEKFVPGPIVQNEEELLDFLERADGLNGEQSRAFQNRYMAATDGNATKRVIRIVHQLINDENGIKM